MATTARGKIKERIREKISILTVRVKLETAVGHTDINHEAEDFYCGLLNLAFGWHLSNLNELHMNYPAIDLADRENRIAVQVTSTDERKKVQATLDRFFEKRLDSEYDRLIVLIIGKKPDYRKAFSLKSDLDFDKKRDIWDTETLSRQMDTLDESRLIELDRYLQEQLPEQQNQKSASNGNQDVVTELCGIKKAVETMAANSAKQLSGPAVQAAEQHGAGGVPINSVHNAAQTVHGIIEPIVRAHGNTEEVDNDAIDRLMMEALRNMVNAFGVNAYDFNLAIDIFVEQADHIEEPLVRILEREIPKTPSIQFQHEDIQVLFCGYYALSLIYKKTGEQTKLKDLLDARYQVFREFPLCFEVRSRCCKHRGELRQALAHDQYALDLLQKDQIDNCAVKNSYASTVAKMLKKRLRVSDGEIQDAKRYIDDAIAYNGNYPKYYFVKAQLIYYACIRGRQTQQTCDAVFAEAKALVRRARTILHTLYKGRSVNFEAETKAYSDFLAEIEKKEAGRKKGRTVRKFEKMTEQQKTALKNQILESGSQGTCPNLPEPRLTEKDEYLYICAAAEDYKSVCCDLVELYQQKVPYRYGETLGGDEMRSCAARCLEDGNCVGVLFYISRQSLTDPSFCRVIELVREMKDYYAVNLEGTRLPSEIVIDTILEKCQKGSGAYPVDGEALRTFLAAFGDKQKYTEKECGSGAQGNRHIPELVEMVRRKFSWNSSW